MYRYLQIWIGVHIASEMKTQVKLYGFPELDIMSAIFIKAIQT